ncbi:hypothetical protein [Streptomyces sp. NBC_00572]|uniref:hypothetical protein n=1 Tax=Streptomyces sp. NBC_00572 TaxID=2903664 RepID=UPI00224D374D|nr:hypothetical protein [Streptomyces sp. NBC_00572]MCX4985224.1 hypothetical protein [Streptomyces sp. NBC_00572]
MAVAALASAVVGCGGAEPSDAKPSDVRPSAGKASAEQPAAGGEGETTPSPEQLAADPGTRYTAIAVPALEGLVCDEGDGGFHYGSDLDMSVTGDDDLKEIEGDSQDVADEVSCFGSPRNVLRKGTMSASAPMFTARTNLYEHVADPTAALNRIFDASVEQATGYGRNFTGEAKTVTDSSLVVKCRQNVTDTFPMTTCFWANYGAAGVVDFFPADDQYVPIDSAVPWTRSFATGALRR